MYKSLKITLCLLVLLTWLLAPFVEDSYSAQEKQLMNIAEITSSKMSCEECHQKTTPRVYQEHMASMHAKKEVGCADCHGTDHRKMSVVTACSACKDCHPKEADEFLASSHSKTWKNMQANARYQKQPEVVKRQGCESCHRIGYGENDGRCDFCHTKHVFSKAEATNPKSCYTCHMGPDHPQMEAYRKSGHHFTPATCASCHFPGTHNTNQNLNRLSSEYISIECAKCHDQAFNKKWMEGAAMLEEQGKKLLAAGRVIIEQLNKNGLLYPDPRNRNPNPVEGTVLVLGAHQLYEDTSRAEKIYFEMQKYLQVHLVQGAYHQDFKMAAYQGLIPLQKHLEELQSEAVLLEELAAKKELLSPISLPIIAPAPGPMYQDTYESSFHGVLPDYRQKPACKTCHQGEDVAKTDWSKVCGTCHTTVQAAQFVKDMTGIKQYAQDLRKKADGVVEEMITRKIARRDADRTLMLVAEFGRNQQAGEVLMVRLVQYLADLDQSLDLMILGVGHSNPDYAHWYGNAPAKSDLIEIRDAAHKLLMIQNLHQNGV
ncbi:MAG: hypothetical protein KJ804_10395 [Proteobacteria bacterium]|nr:hypothetical protein [Pseudomonadota bacterium]